MAPIVSFEPGSEDERHTAARSKFFKVIEEFFDFPDEEFYLHLTSGQFMTTLSALAKGLPYTMTVPPALSAPQYNNYDDYASDFMRIFEVSVGGPPCPLNEGHYYEDRQKVMEELVRFYEHFDLKANEGRHELPDHISAELDFMHFLTFKEAGALHFHKDPTPYRRAQKDFLERHLLKWFPTLLEKLLRLDPPEFFRSACEFVNGFLVADHRNMLSILGSQPR